MKIYVIVFMNLYPFIDFNICFYYSKNTYIRYYFIKMGVHNVGGLIKMFQQMSTNPVLTSFFYIKKLDLCLIIDKKK